MNKLLELESTSRTVMVRGYLFTCSYSTVWDQWLNENEKNGLSYEEVANYIVESKLNHKERMQRFWRAIVMRSKKEEE